MQIINSLLRRDYISFLQKAFYHLNPTVDFEYNWHFECLAKALEEVSEGKNKRLIVNLPPRSLKSITINVAWPAWVLGNNPSSRIITASYSNALSYRHAMDIKMILMSSWYQRIFPDFKIIKNTKSRIVTSDFGFIYATSVGGSITGDGADILILDDPHNPQHVFSDKMRKKVHYWYENTFSSRLNNPKEGSIIIVMQRLHENDLVGYLLGKNSSIWKHIKIPAKARESIEYECISKKYVLKEDNSFHESRYTKEILNKIENEIGYENFSAQYLQQPCPMQKGMLSKKYIVFYKEVPTNIIIMQSWDTAIKTSESNDFSVCTTWGIYKDMYQDKIEYPLLKEKLVAMAKQYKAINIIIEDKASGHQLLQDLKHKMPLVPQKPILDKKIRFSAIMHLFYYGAVMFNPVIDKSYIQQITNFPYDDNDDIVDSISQFLNYIRNIKTAAPRIRKL